MKTAVIQLCSQLEPQINLEKISNLIAKAKTSMAIEAVFLPEVFYSMSDGTKATPYLVEKENEHYQAIRNIALEHNVYLLGGSAATKLGDKVVNRAYNFAPNGTELASYDKLNLFSVDLSKDASKTVLDEATVYTQGSRPQLLDLGEWRIGLGICFDLRFPELYRHYFSRGANLMTVASAFTVPTGKAHWEALLRARAIENQSYVIASAQWGKHNERISTYGHSMIVDPWGEVICQVGEGEGFAVAEISLERVSEIRQRMKVAVKTYM